MDEHERILVIHEEKCHVLCQTVEHMSERQDLLVAMLERKKIMSREAPEEFQKQIFQEIKKLEERLSEKEMELLGKKHSLERMYRDRTYAKMEEGREACCST